MSEINDYELLMLCQENNEDAEKILYEKYIYLIKYYINKYRAVFKVIGINKEEIYSECLITFNTALNSYNPQNNATFKTFLSFLLKRKIEKLIKKHNNGKHQFQNTMLSLDYTYNDASLMDFQFMDLKEEPLNKITLKGYFEELNEIASKKLSTMELKVYKLLLCNVSYQDIAKMLNKNYKQITNTIDRIRKKLKPVVTEVFLSLGKNKT